MNLNEYIKMSYERPNRKVLEGLGASEDLIEYLMETPGNTNWNMLNSLGSGGGGDTGEVWLVGDTVVEQGGMALLALFNVDATDHMAELTTNGNQYKVFLNGTELPFASYDETTSAWAWYDSDDATSITKAVTVTTAYATAVYMNPSTAPTSVEVSVKAK